MPVTAVDAKWEHLWPDFAQTLRKVLEETAEKTARPWKMAEGYRSVERQLWLYASGRTRPGPVVTWMRVPINHGSGLAADCYPSPMSEKKSFYEVFRANYLRHGLDSPPWSKGDLGHVQLSNAAVRVKATAWCEAGFPSGGAPLPGVAVKVAGVLVPTIPAFLEEGASYVGIRALAPYLNLAVLGVTAGKVSLVQNPPTLGEGMTREEALPLTIRHGAGYVSVKALAPFATADWNASTRTVSFAVLG